MSLFERSERATAVALGDRARALGDWEAAAEHYRAALARAPGNVPIWVQYGHALKESGRHPQAEAAYRRAAETEPDAADPHLQLGILLRLQGRTAEAEAAFLRALALDPRLTPTAEDLAEFGWTAERIAQLRRGFAPARPQPRRRASLITLADRARDLGQWAEAARLYAKALGRNPRRPDIWVQYGHMLKETGRAAEAERAYRQALAHDGGVADTHLQLGHALKLQGRTEDARAAYLLAFALEPTLQHPLMELAELGWAPDLIGELRATCAPAVLEDASQPEHRRVAVTAPDLSSLNGLEPRGSIAVVLHLFEAALWDEMRQAIDNVPHPFDLFVSVTRGHSDHMRDAILAAFPFAQIFVFEDHGRDVGAFMVFLHSGVLLKYELICKIHTKKSPHILPADGWPSGDAWRRQLIGGVLGSRELIDRIVANFRTHPDLGIVVAGGNLVSAASKWANNERWLGRLLPRLGYPPDVDDCPFPGGNIFWIRSSLLRPLLDLGIELGDFEPEPLPLDGALGHAIERVFGFVCKHSGMLAIEHRNLLSCHGTTPADALPTALAVRVRLANATERGSGAERLTSLELQNAPSRISSGEAQRTSPR